MIGLLHLAGGDEKRKHDVKKEKEENEEKQEEKNNFLSIIVNEILYSAKYIIYSS